MKDNTNVARLNTSLNAQVDAVNSKKKDLRSELSRRLLASHVDWKLHAIAQALCDSFGAAFYDLHYQQYKGSKPPVVESSSTPEPLYFRKGCRRDKATKEVAKHFFLFKEQLEMFVSIFETYIKKSSGILKVNLYAGWVSLEPSTDREGENEQQQAYTLLLSEYLQGKEELQIFRQDSSSMVNALARTKNGKREAFKDSVIINLMKEVTAKYDLDLYFGEVSKAQSDSGHDMHVQTILIAPQ